LLHNLFWSCNSYFNKSSYFHALSNSIFFIRVPIIGGKDLDLHQLYKEVTSRGGIDKASNGWNTFGSINQFSLVISVNFIYFIVKQ
jgi:hypothetical protein